MLKSIGGGHTLTDWNVGFSGVATGGGTAITHGLKNASGVATAPTVAFLMPTASGYSAFVSQPMGSTTFTAVANTGGGNFYWLAILL